MISHHQKEQLKEEAQKARHAQAMRSLQRPPTMNSTLFTEPKRGPQNSDNPIMSHIHKVLGNYQEGVEEIGKIYDIDKNIRSTSRDANNQQKYKIRPNGVNRPPNNNNLPSGRGQEIRHIGNDLSQIMPDEPKLFQNSSASLPSKESGRNSLDTGSHSRSSQSLRLSGPSRQLPDKYGAEKDSSSSSLSYQQKNKYGHSYANHKSHSSSSSSSISSSHNHPGATGLGSSSGGGGTKSSRPLPSLSADLHHSDKSVHNSGSEKNYSNKHQSSAPDKHHGSNVNKTYSDLKVYSDKHHGDGRGHPTSDGRAHSSSSERTIGHSSLKGRSLSPASLPPPNLQPQPAVPQLSQSHRQGPPLLQPQQTQQQQLPPQLQHQQPPTIIPVTTGSDIDENHHCSPSISPSSIFNATNNRMKPSQLTPQHTTKSSKLSPPHLPENLFSDEDNDVNRIVREMTSQPEKLTAIKTPVKNYASLRVKKKPEKDSILGNKASMPDLSLNQNPRYKSRSRPGLSSLEIPRNFHGCNVDNLSPDDADLTDEKDKTELDKIITEMTCIKSPITAIFTPEKIKNAHSTVSDSEGSASDVDERRPSDEKPCHSSSSDEDINSHVNQLDLSQEKEAITEEVKNHMPMMLSPMLDGPMRVQEDLSQDLEMSDSDNESIKSGSSPSLRHKPPPLICEAGLKMRKDSSGFDIPTLQENDSDCEMEDVYENPAADVHNSEVPTEVAVPTDPIHFCGTPKLCAPTARKGSRESPQKHSDNEESEDDDSDDDDNEEEEEEEEKEIKSEDERSAGPEEPQPNVDQGSACSTSGSESTEDESDGSDEEERPHRSPSPPSEPAKPAPEAEPCDSSSSIQKSPTLSWSLRYFITKPNETKLPKVTDPQNKSESDNCSSVANSNHSSPSNKGSSSDDSSSNSANSDSDEENPSHKSLLHASPDKSPLLSDSEELPEDSGSLKRKRNLSSAMEVVTPTNKNEALVSHTSTKTTPTVISTSLTTTTTMTTSSSTTTTTTKLHDWPRAKIQKENVAPTSTPASLTSLSIDKKHKRKVSVPVCINLSLLSPPPHKKPKLPPEPSQPAVNFNAVKLEPVPCSQSSPEAAVDKKICPPKRLLKHRITLGSNSRRKRPVMVKIDVNLMELVPMICKGELLTSVKTETPKSPADLVSPSAANKPFVGSSISGASTPKSAPSKSILTSEIMTNTTTTTPTQTATTPPSLPPLPTTTTTVATTPPPPSASSSTLSSNTSMVTATSKTVLLLAPPSTTSTASTLEKDFNFRIPMRNAESDSQEHRLKMTKNEVQSSKSEAKTDPVKTDSSKKSDIAANKSSALPPPENLFASNKGNKLSKELKPQGAKSGQTCHDNNIDPTVSAPVDENCNSMPNPNTVSNDKYAKEKQSAPSISSLSKPSSDSLKDMTKAATASSSTSTSSSSSVVVPSSTSKSSLSSPGASSAASVADPRLIMSTITSSTLNTNSNSTSAGDCSSTSNNSSSSKRSSDNIRSGRPPVKVQSTTGSNSGSSSSSSSSNSSSSSKQKNSVSFYFQEATKMKHEGNNKTDIFEKAYLYMRSVVYYMLCGIAMEKSRKHQDCYKMFSETFELLEQIGHYHQYPQEPKLAVLRLLLMSAICKKHYDLKKKVAENLRQVLDEHYKQYSSSASLSATAQSHTPSPVRPNLNISTPSSRSTPSPSGSIDSIRSQGSSTSDARLTPSANTTTSCPTTTTNTTSSCSTSTTPSSSINPHSSSVTNASTPSSSQTVVIPKRIHSITRNYMEIMDYLAKAHHYSDQAAIQRDNCKDFTELLNSRKTISLQSSIVEHVEYVEAGLQLLQNS